mmetsp:Transcript_15182/g.65009  ORF Transcript_15182/g.65009 Transcript_15182/m.65009 type:complete len:447 (+) Transcript_15182:375-1715(+)
MRVPPPKYDPGESALASASTSAMEEAFVYPAGSNPAGSGASAGRGFLSANRFMSPSRKPSRHVSLYRAMGTGSRTTSTAFCFFSCFRSAVMFSGSRQNPFTVLGLRPASSASATPIVRNSGLFKYDAYEGERHAGFSVPPRAAPGPDPPEAYPASNAPFSVGDPFSALLSLSRAETRRLGKVVSSLAFIASSSSRSRAISARSAALAASSFATRAASFFANASSSISLAMITACSSARRLCSARSASAMLGPKMAANSKRSSSRSPFSSHLENISTKAFWSTLPSPRPSVRASAGSLRTPMIISRTVTVPLSSLSRNAKMDSMASFSPRAASAPTADASSSRAKTRPLGGDAPALDDESSSEESSEDASESESDASSDSLLARFTARFMRSFANALTSNVSAISPSKFAARASACMECGTITRGVLLMSLANSVALSSPPWSSSNL